MLFAAAIAHAVEVFDGQAFYFGDLHAHTGASNDGGSSDIGACPSGGCGAFADFEEVARNDNGLDFVGVVDHVNYTMGLAPDVALFESVYASVNAMNDEAGGFITIPGAELTFNQGTQDLGHKSLLMFGSESSLATVSFADLTLSDEVSAQVDSCDAIWDAMDVLTASFGNALLIPHHPAAKKPMATDWDCFSAEYGGAVEAWSAHGSSVSTTWAWEPLWSGAASGSSVDDAMDLGLRFGLVGGSDNHDTHPGSVCALDVVRTSHWYAGSLTVAVLEETEAFTRSSLYEAIADWRTYLTTGPQLPAKVSYSYGGTVRGGMGASFDGWVPADGDVTVNVTFPPAYDAMVTEVLVHGAAGAEHSATWVSSGEYEVTIAAADVGAYLAPHLLVDQDLWWGGTPCEDGYEDFGAGGSEDGLEHVLLTPSWFGASPYYTDADGDGFTVIAGDCDDAEARAYPGATDLAGSDLDEDCDGVNLCYADADDDGVRTSSTLEGSLYCDEAGEANELATAGDCDDADPARFPGAHETVGDGVDENCDGRERCFFDGDGDGHLPDRPRIIWGRGLSCTAPREATAATPTGDCNDTDRLMYAGAPELDCSDPRDYNCDGTVVYRDDDGDGWAACDECDDSLASVNPNRPELCNLVDDDCNGVADDSALDATIWYADRDGDGYGDAALPLRACSAPERHVADSSDCNDHRPDVHPGAFEPGCDDPTDHNCDGSGGLADADGDGWPACEDCDDRDAAVNPEGRESCNGLDDDCSGEVDEDASDAHRWYADRDGDGYGSPREAVEACEAPEGWLSTARDCDDAAASTFPGAPEVAYDGVDQDCNGKDDRPPLPQEPPATCASEAGGAIALSGLLAGMFGALRRARPRASRRDRVRAEGENPQSS